MHCILRRCSVSQDRRFTKTDQIEKTATLGTCIQIYMLMHIRSNHSIFQFTLLVLMYLGIQLLRLFLF